MIKKLLILLIPFVLLTQLSLSTFALEKEQISAQTAVLMDADTGQVLYNKNMNQQMHPASITKIMTGLLVAENSDMTDEMEVTRTALNISADSSSIWLQEGEVITVDDGLYALMIASANDSANVLAEHVAGSQEEFIRMMNARTKEIGAKNTNFENTHGLTKENHLTTAYDMALIAREAIKNENFYNHFGVANYVIPRTNKTGTERYLKNHHAMLNTDRWEYAPDVIAGKTGYTHAAGNTLVTVAERNGKTLIAVVMKTGGIFGDTQSLFDYGFRQFEQHSLSTADLSEEIMPLMTDEHEQIGEATVIIPEKIEVSLPANITTEDIDISMEIEYPAEVNPNTGEKPVLKVTTMENLGTMPQELLEIPLEYATQMFEPDPEEMPVIEEPLRIKGPLNSAHDAAKPKIVALDWILSAIIISLVISFAITFVPRKKVK